MPHRPVATERFQPMAKRSQRHRSYQDPDDAQVLSLQKERIKRNRKQQYQASDRQPTLDYRTEAQYHYGQAIDQNTLTFGLGPAGTGKAQPLYSRVRVPGGWITMGEVEVGTVVCTPNGKTAPVAAIYPQGKKTIYRFTFEDGRTTDCCDDHLWKVHTHEWSRVDGAVDGYRVVTTRELRQWIEMPSKRNRLYIPLTSAVQDPKVDLPIPPYLLGILIAEGCLTNGTAVSFTSPDAEIVERVRNLIPTGMTLHVNSDGLSYRIVKETGKAAPEGGNQRNPLLESLRELDLMGKASYEKTIPASYLYTSIEQRMELLRGLLDGDGTVDKVNGTVSYCSTSYGLARQLQMLVRSMGGLAKITTKHPHYTYDGEVREGRIAYNVFIRHPDRASFFHLARQKARASGEYQYSDCLRLRIKDIQEIGEYNAQCISIADAEHLYITDDYVVTHNTWVATAKAALKLLDGEIEKIIVTRPMVSGDESDIGSLPGTVLEKFEPWFAPVRQILEQYLGKGAVGCHLKNGNIVVLPLQFMRGWTFKDCFVLVDECQNATKKQMELLLTRIGENCTIVVNGDEDQCDLHGANGLTDAVKRLKGVTGIASFRFTVNDIVRSRLAREVVARYHPVKHKLGDSSEEE